MSGSNSKDRNDRDDDCDDDRDDDRDDDHGNNPSSGRTIRGTNGNDVLAGTTGNDRIYGGNGNDRLAGGAGNDEVDGGSGDDTIDGGSGNDRLAGGSGKDTLIGGAGNDNIDGGSGIDVAVYSGNFRDYKLTLSRDGGHSGEDDDDHSAMTVHDKRPGAPDGVDVLKNVEILRFADGEYSNGRFTPYGTPATIGNPTAATVTEDVGVSGANLVATGTISISDPDAGQAVFQTGVTGVAGNLGALVLLANGSYTYTVANGAVQHLGAGISKVDSFTIRSADGTAKVVSFTINGTNDGAAIGSPTVSAVTEDVAVDGSGLLKASGSLSVSDVDSGQSSFQTLVVGVGSTLGSLSLAANGAYTYSVANSAVQSLGAGVTKVESFTVTSFDGTTKVVSFTINGTNDAAAIGAPTVSAVTEDAAVDGSGLLKASGALSVADVDSGQSSFQTSVVGATANLGSLVIDANGNYTYTVANSATQYLGASDAKVDSFTITSVDGTSKTVSFTINGTNDLAVIGTPTVSAVTEDVAVDGSGLLKATGILAIADADADQAGFQATITGVGSNLGSLALAANGAYTYSVANSAVQSLGAGVTKVESFTVTSVDGTTRVVSFTISGNNDSAVIGAPTVSAVTEDVAAVGGNLIASGTISVSDADAGQAGFQTTVFGDGTNLGSLVLATNGNYTYSVANSTVQFLGVGLSRTDSFLITSLDGTIKTVSFTINGRNDAAAIGSPTVSTVTEDVAVDGSGLLKASGSLSVADVDSGQSSFQTLVVGVGSTLGSLSLAANGAYTYSVANSAVQSLGTGVTKVESFTVTSFDGTTKVVSFTINGANDAAVIGSPTVSAVTEDVAVDGSGLLKATGILAIADADTGQLNFQTSVVGVGSNLGSLALAANGAYTYSVANSAVQSLGAGVNKAESFTIRSADGTAKVVSFTINGTNDAAAIGMPTVSAVTEDVAVDGSGLLKATGILSIGDADTGQSSFLTSVVDAGSNLGSLALAANGAYTYSVANSAVQYLGAGATKVEDFTVTSLDGTSRIVSFTINGISNDAADIGYPDVATVTEDAGVVAGRLTAAGLIPIIDPNAGEAFFQMSVISAPGNIGTLVIDADGNYSYSVDNNAVQYLGAGVTRMEDFTITSLDGTTQTASFTINGANDAAEIGLPPVNAVTEGVAVVDGRLSAMGVISIADLDAGEADFQTSVISGPGNLGTLTLASNGAYTYSVANSDVEYLAPGSSREESFTITSLDGSFRTVSFTINGASPAVIGTPPVDAVTEDVFVNGAGQLTATGVISIADADPGQDSFQTSVLGTPGNLGALTIDADGAYTYAVDNSAVQFLGKDITKVEDFTITSLDGTTRTASFHIHGANEAPVVLNEVRTIQEDEVVVFTANDATDLDLGDTLTITAVSGATFGTAELVGGAIVFRPTLNYNSIDQFGASSAPASFTYTVSDQHGATATATVTLNIAAVADAPIVPVPANLGFELASFHNWEILGGVGLASNVGSVSPFDGSERLAVLDSTWVEQGDLERFLGIASGGLTGLAGGIKYTGLPGAYVPHAGYYHNVTDGSAMRTSLAVSAGEVITFNWYFSASDAAPYGDFGFVVIDGVAKRLAGIATVGDQGSSGWQTYSHTVKANGILSLGFGVADTGDIDANAQLLIDNLRFDGSAADGDEDSAILLAIGSQLADADGSEALSLTKISGVPFGAVLSAGTNNLDGTWTLTQADLLNLTITPPPDYFGTFTLTVSATSTESSNGDQATATKTFAVTVFPVSDGSGPQADAQVIVPTGSPTVGLNIAEPVGIVGDVLVTSVPRNGLVTTGDGSPVTAGTLLSAAELAGLGFTPNGLTGSNSGMSYTWTDGLNTNAETHSFSLVSAKGAIRVAIVHSYENPVSDGAGGEQPLSLLGALDIYDQLDNDSYFDFAPDLIQVNVADSAAHLLAVLSGYDVVVHAGSMTDVMTAAYWSALRQYVENDEGGVITVGRFAYTLGETSLATSADADFVTPIALGDYTTASGTASTFSVTGGHEITYGIDTVPGPGFNDTILEGALQIDLNAISLALHPAGGHVIAYTDVSGLGRTVYLGEPYAESEVAGVHTEPVRSGYADQLLEQAVAWAAKGKAETRSVTSTGGTGNDVLSGGADNDTLSGNGGNDQLTGAGGSDTLTGGSGSDRFYYNDIGDGGDTITDFAAVPGGDMLDIHALLTGYDPLSSDINGFIKLQGIGADTQVNVDADGGGGGDNFVPLALLSGVTMSGTLLDDLLLQGNLVLG